MTNTYPLWTNLDIVGTYETPTPKWPLSRTDETTTHGRKTTSILTLNSTILGTLVRRESKVRPYSMVNIFNEIPSFELLSYSLSTRTCQTSRSSRMDPRRSKRYANFIIPAIVENKPMYMGQLPLWYKDTQHAQKSNFSSNKEHLL